MSRATPRKSRHRQHPSIGGHVYDPGQTHGFGTATISEYESDTAQYLDSRDVPPPSQLGPRTNTEINLKVLDRYLPGIQSIISIAPSCSVYVMDMATQKWEKPDVEGTLFVCEQAPIHGQAQASVFVLNRKSLNNVAIDLARVGDFEMTKADQEEHQELLAFAIEDDSGKINQLIGLWVHADKEDTQEVNFAAVLAAWQTVRANVQAPVALPAGFSTELPGASGSEAPGRRLSINELFHWGKGPGNEN